MAFRAGKGIIKLDMDSSGVSGGISGLGKKFAGLGTIVAGTAAGMAAAMAVVTVGLFKAGKAFAVQEKAETKLAAVLKATGNAAGFTAKELIKQAAAMQKVTTHGDEVIINAQAMMATFKNIRGDVFQGAIEAAADMAVVMETDLKSAVIQVGKALNDPIVGVTALGRVGVTFSNQQKQMIKTLVETGKGLEAQGIILKELESQFGGTSEMLRKTMGGSWIAAMNAWGDAWEDVGKALAPVLTMIAELMTDRVVPAVQALIGGFEGAGEGIKLALVEIAASVTSFADHTVGVFANLKTNLINTGKEIASWFSSSGFDFEWKGLLDIDESAITRDLRAKAESIAAAMREGVQGAIDKGVTMAPPLGFSAGGRGGRGGGN